MIISSLYLRFAGTRIHRLTWRRMRETSPQAASAATTSQCSPTLPLRPNSHSGTTTALQTFTPPVPKLPGHRYRAGTHHSTLVNRSAVCGGQGLCCWEPTCSDHADLSVLKGEGLILVRSSRFLSEICTTGFQAVWQCQSFSPVVFSSLSGLSEDVALVKFMYFAFTCLPCWNHCRQFKSLVLCSCDVFQALMNALCLLFLKVFGFASPSLW